MGAFFSNLLMKYLGTGFMGRAATTIMGSVGALVTGLNLMGVTAEDITNFTKSGAKILGGLGLMALGFIVDGRLNQASKPEQPKIIE